MNPERCAIGDPALDLVVRREEDADTPFLHALFAASARAVLAPSGLPEPALAHLVDMQWRGQRAAYASAFPDARRWIALQSGERVGRLLEADVTGGVHIIDIAVSPERRRMGVATALVAMVMDGLAAGREVRAEVAISNPASFELFGRLGFTEVFTPGGSHVGVSWRAPTVQSRRGSNPARNEAKK